MLRSRALAGCNGGSKPCIDEDGEVIFVTDLDAIEKILSSSDEAVLSTMLSMVALGVRSAREDPMINRRPVNGRQLDVHWR